jgi:predicted permease
MRRPLHRALLYLYPASFRAEYGEEIHAVFQMRLRDASGPLARAAVWTGAFPEVFMNAAAVHWDILKQDLRYTARTLGRAPGFALTAIAIVALAVGANTAAFSVTDFVLIRPLPFTDPDRLVTVWQRSPGYSRMELSPPNIQDWKAAARSFESVGIYRQLGANLIGSGEPIRIGGAQISVDLFPTLGVEAAVGRIFATGEDGARAPRTVVLSDRLWRSAFGGDPAIVGRTILLDADTYSVIGVMPPGFAFPRSDVVLWTPLAFTARDLEDRTNNEIYAVARLKPGVTLDAARAEMDLIAAQTRQQFPKENANTGATVFALRDDLSAQSRMMVLALSGAAFCVLLIACANLANLLLARALGRRQEMAVRAAMGAGRERLVRQLATESVVLAALGGAAGVLLAGAMVPLLWSLVPAALPTDSTPGVDLRVMIFAALLTLGTALAFGLMPMIRSGAGADASGLREGPRAIGGRKEKLRAALVTAEVAASIVLIITTGLLVRTLWAVQARDPGFRADGVLTLRTDLPVARYAVTARRADFYDQVLREVRALPGVTTAAYTSGLPMVWGGGIWPVGINGVELERRATNTASMRFVTPGYFATMSVPIRAGRDVSDSDTMTSEFVAVVSESLVRRYWPDGDAVGRRFNFATKDRTIVGVVADVRVRGLERDSEPQVYLPHRQVDDGWFWGYTPKYLVVSAQVPLGPLAAPIRGIIQRVDPQQPVSDLRSMRAIVLKQTAPRSVQARVLAGFAFVALLLAAIGIHGVLAFAVSQRTPEIGVRIALGAQRRDILVMVTAQGLRLVVAGLVPGLILAYLAGRSLETLLVGVAPADPSTFAVAAAVTAVMAIAGTLLPTLRAVRIDPLRALRAE